MFSLHRGQQKDQISTEKNAKCIMKKGLESVLYLWQLFLSLWMLNFLCTIARKNKVSPLKSLGLLRLLLTCDLIVKYQL